MDIGSQCNACGLSNRNIWFVDCVTSEYRSPAINANSGVIGFGIMGFDGL